MRCFGGRFYTTVIAAASYWLVLGPTGWLFGVGSADRLNAAEPIDIGSRLELLVDDYLIKSLDGARLELHRPVAREVAIEHDAAWEGNVCGYHTVFQDGDLYRMYYRGAHAGPRPKGAPREVACYAESTDGIHWKKPNLGLFEFDGSKENNIVWVGAGCHNFCPFKDTNPDCKPEARYKALGVHEGGLHAFQSADGIRWKKMAEKAVITHGAFDSQNLAFWDETIGAYREYHRHFRDGVRDIMTATSKDFLQWPQPVWLKYPGAAKEHLYTNQVLPYFRAPHILMGFPKRFVPARKPEHFHMKGVSDGVFMTSRDGVSFHRWGEAFLRPGLQPECWVCRNNMIAWGLVLTENFLPNAPEEISLYATENYYQGDSVLLRRHTVRQDGFVSLSAPFAGGSMVTRTLKFAGGELVLNFSTSAAGSVQVEVQDDEAKPLPGFALTDCPEIFGDAIARPVAWKGEGDLSKLAGKAVRLRFVLKDADLYSFRFREAQ